ncbi:hypothetical protein FGO68_gene11746 [Halteria grandinella]|uniref:Uncharacterized protein n=1 Tax=Halteria grandinella TaxID=5974 RepID=A0A8J8NY04_HALGN|nr:hypothetical protein FGO68_gene11746 [Halteria grandinella]
MAFVISRKLSRTKTTINGLVSKAFFSVQRAHCLEAILEVVIGTEEARLCSHVKEVVMSNQTLEKAVFLLMVKVDQRFI